MRPSARTAVLEVDLSLPVRDHTGLDGYSDAQVLLRLHGEPLAVLKVPVTGGCVAAADLLCRIIDDHTGRPASLLIPAGSAPTTWMSGFCSLR